MHVPVVIDQLLAGARHYDRWHDVRAICRRAFGRIVEHQVFAGLSQFVYTLKSDSLCRNLRNLLHRWALCNLFPLFPNCTYVELLGTYNVVNILELIGSCKVWGYCRAVLGTCQLEDIIKLLGTCKVEILKSIQAPAPEAGSYNSGVEA
jgi:hypothetical protein